jgi:RNA polymerase sigma factor for flagellar operon FliA
VSTYSRDGTLDRSQDLQQYFPLVRRMAHHMVARLPASVQVEDLIQAGMIGLLDALGRFEEGQGAQFETYATQRIKGAMLDELRRCDWLPRGIRQIQRRIETAMQKLEHRLGRIPSESEMAREMGLTLEAYQDLLLEARGSQLFYYEDLDADGEGDDYLDRHVTEHAEDPESTLGDQRFRQAVIDGIEKLPEREKLVMGLYYEQDMNFKEIAAVLGVTESRVCQLHSQSIARLRTKLKGWRG